MRSSRSHRRITRSLLAAPAICALLCAASSPAFATAKPTPAPVLDINPPLGEVPATAASVTCSPVIVYASRGSSENSNVLAAHAPGQFEPGTTRPMTKYYEGLGEELEPMYVMFRDTYPAGYVSLVTNRAPQSAGGLSGGTDPNGPATLGYRAVGIEATLGHVDPFVNYEQSALQGVPAAIRDLTLIHTRCPNSKLALIAYSEGVEVTRRALAQLGWTPAAGMVAGVMFGDVLYKAGDPNVTFVGDAARDEKGVIRAGREGDNGFRSPVAYAIKPIPLWPPGWNLTTYCHGGDLACQWRGGTLVAHSTYHSDDAVGSSSRLARAIGGPFIKPVITARTLNAPRSCYVRGARVIEELSIAGSPAGTSATITSDWEPFPWDPFQPVKLGDGAVTKRVAFQTFLSPRVTISYDGHKLDYRDMC